MVEYQSNAGHEKKRKTTCLVLSPKIYNEKGWTLYIFPISKRSKGNPFEVIIRGVFP
jgi:mRNA-degrading endonuclease toxin of MazEF toxin-antitoxin module